MVANRKNVKQLINGYDYECRPAHNNEAHED